VSMLDRLREVVSAERSETPRVERTLRKRFVFLEERRGFRFVRSEALADGARVAYKNVPAGRAIVIYARASRGAWAGVGRLDPEGRLRPVTRETIERGEWRLLAKVALGSESKSLDEAIETLAAKVGGRRAV
jgi:hypothetical protein